MSRLTIQALQFVRGERRILDDINLHFESGCVTAVLGPNGAGKSTLLASVAGLLEPASGKIDLDGQSISAMPASARARRISFLPQSPEIAWPIDVETLVGLARIPFHGVSSAAEDAAAVTRAMESTQIAQWSKRTVTTLSGGERARALLARIFAGEPEWILADEPFAGLDPSHQFEAADLLCAYARGGRGVVLTIHDLTLAARIADRIVILQQGRVVADGTPSEALTPATLRSVYGIDAEWLTVTGPSEQRIPLIAIHGRHVG
jgi:iron complex transport system ATP-binding protein